MTKRNEDFFAKKKSWSVVKDTLLGCYLEPYFAKILSTTRPLVYVDCFAGKGRFDDGNDGSPCIALNIFKQRLQKMRGRCQEQNVDAYFIELNHVEELTTNLALYTETPNLNVVVKAGNYENQIQNILQGHFRSNVFLYLDPYGVKHLDFKFLSTLSTKNFNSVELLINFNSHGFLRSACKFLTVDVPDEINWNYLAEYDNVSNIPSNKSEQMLNRVAGGDYWKDLVHCYYKKNFDFYTLEEKFVKEYCHRLRNYYAYVLNMPIRIKEHHSPKYRMIHVTNHPDGAVLMANNIYQRKGQLRLIQHGGQQVLFGLDYDAVNTDEIIEDYLSKLNVPQRLNLIQAKFFVDYGVICNSSEFSKIIEILDKKGKLDVVRKPDKTKIGKPSRFYSEGNGQTVILKWKN